MRSVGCARASHGRRFFQVVRELGLLQRTKLDAGVDSVLGVLQGPLGAGKILGDEEFLGVVTKPLVAEDSGDLRKSGAKSRASLGLDGLEVSLEQLPGRRLGIVVRQGAKQVEKVLVLHHWTEEEVE